MIRLSDRDTSLGTNYKFIMRRWKLMVLPVFMALGLILVLQHPSTVSEFVSTGAPDLGLVDQKPVVVRDPYTGREKTLHGRFLHITDIHPDSLYEEGAPVGAVCHNRSREGDGYAEGEDGAPRFGLAMSGCDSPMELMEFTLEWIGKNLRDKIDFVIWTGDNVRHDNDRQFPRTEFEIIDMNSLVSGKFHKLFANNESGNPRDFDVDVVPSLGNNDVFPHNLFALGPTLQTRELYKIWNNYVPEEQQRTFDRGVCFVKEVIPGKLAVISINTLYLFKANPLVDNCNSPKQPGYRLLLWLGYVLEEMRQRNIKVWFSGHVPPIPKNFDDSCFNKFTLWTHEYRDIIVGGLYGHMNVDHFIPVDGKRAWQDLEEEEERAQLGAQNLDFANDNSQDDESYLVHADAARDARLMGAKPQNKVSYMETVKDNIYEKIDKKIHPGEKSNGRKRRKGKKRRKQDPVDIEKLSERYSIVNIAGSVIPTFNPSFRVWEYNISGLEQDTSTLEGPKNWDSFFKSLEETLENDIEEAQLLSEVNTQKKKKKKNGKRKNDKTVPEKNQRTSHWDQLILHNCSHLLRFVEYYADLKSINKEYYELLCSGVDAEEAASNVFRYQVEYTSEDEPFNTKSLLVSDYLKVLTNIVHENDKWDSYLSKAFVSTGYTDDEDD
ncbi:endopolyphosphatase KNAG_0C02780 [Huiozyma naganishii CBS 8797]|uniref:Endopolyphosphatase n=1 Tax=Huiozyma naganishii (strain ATCC MYA-139 / BCRC 22969 / CBS 8797 / KCTC 17520 / NBRC 10181 / NCYC 3082 / Yp74L-3) TaxID=1071383 RepID=J7S4N6_HUIN7|nr:hypothetical protein KNAG_0C02780 [Kazachstania naganishii CBS 8797]CCK69389.1 hypothetical protein KNAG_0C02780 [Kazachstania naganishii CBS 8797]